MRTLVPTLLMVLLALVPLAAAQEENATYDDVIGGNDCPSPEECAAYTGAPTCMDGADANESCDPELYYLGAPTRGPEDGTCENCRGPTADGDGEPVQETREVPFVGGALAALAYALAIVIVGRRG